MTTQAGPFPPQPAPFPWSAGPGHTAPALPSLNPQTGLPDGAEHRDLAYHRLALSDPKHRRWSPLAEGGLLLVGIFVATIFFSIAWGITAVVAGGEAAFSAFDTTDVNSLDITDPWLFVFMFGSIAIWVPVVLAVRWAVRPRPLGLIWSVAGRIRWKWLLLTFGVAAAVFIVIYGSVALLEGAVAATPETSTAEPSQRRAYWWVVLILMVLIVPIQCVAEELVFRGYMAQALGRWLRHPAWVILLPAPLFMLGHLYDVWGQLSVLWMAVVAGFLTWRTGGLEAAISLHVVNNLIATLMSVLWPVDPLQESDASVGAIGFGVIALIETVYAVVVVLLARRGKIAVTRRAVVWPRVDQDRWYARVRAAYAAAPMGPFVGGPYGPYGAPGPQPTGSFGHAPAQAAHLVPVTIPASMAYVEDSRINADGTLDLVPADGLIAYAAPQLQAIPGTDPPVYAHPVVWMARQQAEATSAQQAPVPLQHSPQNPTPNAPNHQEGQQ